MTEARTVPKERGRGDPTDGTSGKLHARKVAWSAQGQVIPALLTASAVTKWILPPGHSAVDPAPMGAVTLASVAVSV